MNASAWPVDTISHFLPPYTAIPPAFGGLRSEVLPGSSEETGRKGKRRL